MHANALWVVLMRTLNFELCVCRPVAHTQLHSARARAITERINGEGRGSGPGEDIAHGLAECAMYALYVTDYV